MTTQICQMLSKKSTVRRFVTSGITGTEKNMSNLFEFMSKNVFVERLEIEIAIKEENHAHNLSKTFSALENNQFLKEFNLSSNNYETSKEIQLEQFPLQNKNTLKDLAFKEINFLLIL